MENKSITSSQQFTFRYIEGSIVTEYTSEGTVVSMDETAAKDLLLALQSLELA